jgi:hypothetical protein
VHKDFREEGRLAENPVDEFNSLGVLRGPYPGSYITVPLQDVIYVIYGIVNIKPQSTIPWVYRGVKVCQRLLL